MLASKEAQASWGKLGETTGSHRNQSSNHKPTLIQKPQLKPQPAPLEANQDWQPNSNQNFPLHLDRKTEESSSRL